MKRYIRSNKYDDQSAKDLKYVGALAEALASVCKSADDDELEKALKPLGMMYANMTDRKQILNALMYQLSSAMKDYRQSANRSTQLEDVEDKLVSFIAHLGYEVTRIKKSTHDAYRITAGYEHSLDNADLKDICKEVSREFGIKADPPIGGSWTSHSFELLGVPFEIGFEHDYDLDPKGTEITLQLLF